MFCGLRLGFCGFDGVEIPCCVACCFEILGDGFWEAGLWWILEVAVKILYLLESSLFRDTASRLCG